MPTFASIVRCSLNPQVLQQNIGCRVIVGGHNSDVVQFPPPVIWVRVERHQHVVNAQRDLNRAHSDGHHCTLPQNQLFRCLQPILDSARLGDANPKPQRARQEIHNGQSIEIFTYVGTAVENGLAAV